MANKKSKENLAERKSNTSICDCTDCLWAILFQYDAPRDPLLAECAKKPQPHSVHFPFEVEVARAKKNCRMHIHTDEVRTPEIRPKRRFYTMTSKSTSEIKQAV